PRASRFRLAAAATSLARQPDFLDEHPGGQPMTRMLASTIAISALLIAAAPKVAMSQTADQNGATQQQIQQRDPDYCGAGGAGTVLDVVKRMKAEGNMLAVLSSAELSQYAYAGAKHQEWKQDCETDPTIILKRLGIEGY